MDDNTTQVSSQINSAVNNALGVGALAAIYTGNFVNFGKVGGALALIAKTITENGVYRAADDGADGYDVVTVNVAGVEILAGADSPTADIGENGQIYLKSVSVQELPEEYKTLEYIETGGTAGAYIDTGVSASSTSYWDLKAQWYNTPDADTHLFGCAVQGKDTEVTYYQSKIQFKVGYSGASLSLDSNPHIYKADDTGLYFDGEKVGEGNWNNVPSLNYYLFDRAGATGPTKYGRIYYCKLYNGDTLVRDFIPAQRIEDNVVGLYDIVNDEFYTNSGSQSFIAGTEMHDGDIIGAYAKCNNEWVDLIGANVNDINLGGE